MSDKVDTNKSAKSTVKTKKVKKCTKCGHEGHRTQDCPQIKGGEKRKALIDWDVIDVGISVKELNLSRTFDYKLLICIFVVSPMIMLD